MSKGPIRRAQLIAPFGVGAMLIVKDGTSLITGGLDQWYKHEPQHNSEIIDINEYVIKEWRLQRMLRVSHFRTPPDFRKKRINQPGKNFYLTIPLLRFPRWHFCLACHRLDELALHRRDKAQCRHCGQEDGKRGYLVQVPLVAMCADGHIQDFPWREWVHRSAYPECQQSMRLIATGSASLASQMVMCDCTARRSLANIMQAENDEEGKQRTYLSSHLENDDNPYLCRGRRPWLGMDDMNVCNSHLRGSLRNASNVYFAQIRSAIYLPRRRDLSESLMTTLEKPPLSVLINTLIQSGADKELVFNAVRKADTGALSKCSDEEIKMAIDELTRSDAQAEETASPVTEDDEETAFRRTEFEVLKTERNEDVLKIKQANLKKYNDPIGQYFDRIMLVEKLRETRVLSGFTRVFAENDQTLEQQKALLWRDPSNPGNDWLPGYVVYGEGIFFEFKESLLQEWSSNTSVQQRIARLAAHYNNLQQERRWRVRDVSPRSVLIHTFSHMLMNRLTFECGYSTSALREKMYISNSKDHPMAGLLIYTAAGDAEGSMGGLVKMGKSGSLEPVILRAIGDASWCSADPVCMEMGNSGGQGPFSCNLAACHGCCLVPETACEEFNRFLDRAMLIGNSENPAIGYFSEYQNAKS